MKAATQFSRLGFIITLATAWPCCCHGAASPAPTPETCAGTLDPSFNYLPIIRPAVVLTEGDKIIVGHPYGLIRFFPSGAPDPSFVASTSLGGSLFGPIHAIKKDAAGRWLVGGYFENVNGIPRPSIARLRPDATVDPDFNPGSGVEGGARSVLAIAIQSDGGILLAGNFTAFAGEPRHSIARLTGAGQLDSNFSPDPGSGSYIHALSVQEDGKILAGGNFLAFNGQPKRHLVRLNADGSLDPTFTAPTDVNADVFGVLPLPDGRIIICGAFSHGETRYVARLHPDGSADPTFTPKLDGPVKSVVVQSDGKFLVAGTFREVDSVHHHLLARLHSDGRLDHSFESGLQMLFGCGDEEAVYAVALDSRNRVMVGGSFFEVNGVSRSGLARLYNDGDRCAGLFGFESAAVAVGEDDRELTLNVIRTGDDFGRACVRVALDSFPSASARDFTALETNLVFGSGVSIQSVTVRIHEDQQVEPGETFTLRLLEPTGGAGLQNPDRCQITIVDDEAAALPGAVDLIFAPAIISGSVTDFKLRSDGKILVMGDLELAGGARRTIVRLNADGTLDPSFDYTGGRIFSQEMALWNELIYLVDSDDALKPLMRLNPDGTVDSSFVSPVLTLPRAHNGLAAIATQSDGRLIIAGGFTAVNGTARAGLARLNLDGSLDTEFEASGGFAVVPNTWINSLRIRPDDSVVVGGFLSSASTGSRQILVAYSSSGVLLDGFSLPDDLRAGSVVNTIARQADGKVIVAGSFYRDSHPARRELFRFNADGALDESFQPAENVTTESLALAVQPDGKILTGSVTRFNQDGSIDAGFYTGSGAFAVLELAVLGNGDILAGGGFFLFNGVQRPGLVRLKGGEYSGVGSFEISSALPAREDSGFAIVNVSRLWSSLGSAQVRLVTHPISARPGIDYVESSATLLFADGEIGPKQALIPLIDDAEHEGSLSFLVALEPVGAGVVVGPGPAEAEIAIIEDDSAFQILPQSLQSVEVERKARVSVTRVGPFVGPASVRLITESGSAVMGADFEGIDLILEFHEGQQEKVLTVPLVDDLIPEGNETFQIKLENPSPGMTVSGPPTTVTILDNAALLGFDPPRIRASQSDSVVRVAVRQLRTFIPGSGDPPSRVRYETVGGSAAPGVEFLPRAGELIFTQSDVTQEVLIPLLRNRMVGAPTTINLRLTATGGETGLTESEAEITLLHPAAVRPDGSLDLRFAPVFIQDNVTVECLARTPEFLYVSGYLKTPDGEDAQLLRFRHTGALDFAFRPRIIERPQVILPQPDGRILIAGVLTRVNDRPVNGLARLTSAGELDESFVPEIPVGMTVHDAKLTPDGKILVVGVLSFPGMSQAYAARLLPNGAADPDFQPILSNEPANYALFNAIALLPDSSAIIGGSFLSVNGAGRTNMVRIDGGGGVDTTFELSGLASSFVRKALPQTDRKIISLGSSFDNDNSYHQLIRLHSNGSLDASYQFPSDIDSNLTDVDRDSAGRAYIGGNFTRIAATRHRFVARLLENGEVDLSFIPPNNLDGGIQALLATPEGLYIAGQFSSVDGSPRRALARLYIDAPPAVLDQPFLSGGRIALRYNFPAGIPYILEATSDFQIWSEITSGATSDGSVLFEADPDGALRFYRVRQK